MYRSQWLGLMVGALALGACMNDTRDYEPPDLPRPLHPSGLASETSDVCLLLSPSQHSDGIYGTDLGYTVALPDGDRLAVLFGDTWSEAADACQYPVTPADDLQASWPRERPDDVASACSMLEYTLDDESDPKSWRRMRLFDGAAARDANEPLETGALRTPVAAWSTHSDVYALFSRGDLAPCESTAQCPEGMLCSNDRDAGATELGKCTKTLDISADPVPQVCRDDDDCGAGSTCNLTVSAMCTTDAPFSITRDDQTITPPWYRDDARLGAAQTMYVGRAAWPERPEDYTIEHRFVTRRFVNATARTIANFDPDDPSANDYRPGQHTLLLWGRPSFVSTGGVQSLPFLLYVPLAELSDGRWQPRFFAGYDDGGAVRWSEVEQDAVPIYGTEAELSHDDAGRERIVWREPEFDYVNQMSVIFVEPLQRFVMMYGGDVPAWLVIDADGSVQEPVNKAPAPGAIHVRSARHPWGRASLDAPEDEAWSSPEPVLTRERAAPYLACGEGGEDELPGCSDQSDENNPLDLLATIAGLASDEPSDALDVTGDCIEGSSRWRARTRLRAIRWGGCTARASSSRGPRT